MTINGEGTDGETTTATPGLASTLKEVRADFFRLTHQFPPIDGCTPFSPQAYNVISATIMESLYAYIEQINTLLGNGAYHFNLGVILFCELHIGACNHYFQEYERLSGFVDKRKGTIYRTVRRRVLDLSLLYKTAEKLYRALQGSIGAKKLRKKPRVGWTGTTTFTWESLASELRGRGVRFSPVKSNGALSIPKYGDQEKLLNLWALDLHQKFAETLGIRLQLVRGFGANEVKTILEQFCSIPAVLEDMYDLVVTGTVGSLEARVVALGAHARGVPVLTIHHGAHYLIFDDPYYALYEGMLPDAKVVYGSIEAQRDMGILKRTVNLLGQSIQLYSRTDPIVQRNFRLREFNLKSSLTGLTAVYIAGHCEGDRYGPYRDVHPSTYLAWQEQLLRWLELHSGGCPIVRPHPKRWSTRYDPVGYHILDGSMSKVLDLADVFVIDYPTTPLAYVTATNKPVLFFDIGLRRLHPAALEKVRERCHYAATNLLHPDEGFAAMKADLSRQCSHSFTPLFSLAPADKDEVTAVADAVCSMLLGKEY